MRSAVVAELRQAIEDTVHGNLDKSNSKLFGMGYTSQLIIDSLIEADFLRLEKKFLVPTEQAYIMMKFLPDTITWPDTTALWKDDLEDIKEGRKT